ncbi:MAG TPA: helix-turn-helix transcriptional regulator [Bacteroidales bacterium]
MANSQTIRVKSIKEFNCLAGVGVPQHPLICLIDYSTIKNPDRDDIANIVFDFYSIAMKRNIGGKLHYGQQIYDFDEGVMSFVAPGQVLRLEKEQNVTENRSGYLLLIHPDFFWGTPLAKGIKKYDFFNYAINEALFLSEKEEQVLIGIMENIKLEYHKDIDKFTQSIIISQIETLLNYADRFYQRQFVTRKITNHQSLSKVEEFLDNYFNSENLSINGLPTVQMLANHLHLSPVYLSNLLKQFTGLSALQHIHEKLMEKAKEKLSTTSLSVSEIAYELGFEHSQSFSKLFKSKTNQSPLEFRAGFN